MSGDRPIDGEQLHKRYLAERDKRLNNQAEGGSYLAIEGDLDKFAIDPHAGPMPERAPVDEEVEVVIVGGGHSGLLAAKALIDRGIDDFRIIEKAGDFGGTWYWNRYPNCRCDVESYIYMPLLDQVGSMPDEKYARSSVIREHAATVGRHLGLYPRTFFQTIVNSARWDEAAHRWIIRTDRGDVVRARFLCFGSGPMHRAKLPNIPGVETFEGETFHSSRWNYAYTGGDETGDLVGLRDKRVAILGTGATGIQIVPALAKDAGHLFVIQRTPAAVDARENKPTDAGWWNGLKKGWWQPRAFNFDAFLVGLPQDEDLVADGWTRTWASFASAAMQDIAEGKLGDPESVKQRVDYETMNRIRGRIDAIVEDPVLAERLKPWYNWFCKRPLFMDGYYEAFNRPNVTLVDTEGRSLDRITPKGFVFDGKEYEVDCIIYASGFEVAVRPDRAGGIDELVGVDGKTLGDVWGGGLRTLHGMFVHDFPNMAIIGGIRHAGFSWNLTYALTHQTRHFASVVSRCLDRQMTRFEVHERAEDDWQKVMTDTSIVDVKFLQECTPSYMNNEGRNLTGGLFSEAYGPGIHSYVEVLDNWLKEGFDRDLALTRAIDA